jgi:8-oxo-dGTP diphosphatase
LRHGDYACALLMKEGKVLLGLRSAARRTYPNCWDILGGFVEAGETIETALVRELGEELGVTATAWAELMVIDEPNPEVNGRGRYHVFLVTDWTGEIGMLGDEHVRLDWFAPTEAADLEALALPVYRDLFALAAKAA